MSPKDKKFVNPLLRSTEPSPEAQTQTPTETTLQTSTQPSTDMPTHTTTQTPTETPTSSDTQTSTHTNKSATTYTSTEDDIDEPVERRNRGKQAFDKTHVRWTLWIRKSLKKQIEKLAKDQEVSHVALAEEAFKDLLKKYGK